MGQALYRKYRSKSLDEIIGQEHITKTLANALKQGKPSHAYLLTGPRGVGKTSVARILAHEVNGLPYDEESHHLDIIEIDAASNRGIEEIRDLREKVHIAPAAATYKIYIIDEVHMLTKQAFNALLKTLEEPPAHVIFVLATTESHKLPETIISRTQRFTFKPVEHGQVVAHLRKIADEEGIKIDEEALSLIAQHGEGSFRDSISLLDQAGSSAKKVTREDILRMLGIPPEKAIKQLIGVISEGSASKLVNLLQQFRIQGFQAGAIAKQVGHAFRQRLIAGDYALPPQMLTNLLRQLISVPSSHDPDGLLEVILLGITLERTNAAGQSPQPTNTVAGISVQTSPKGADPSKTSTQKPKDEPDSKQSQTPEQTTATITIKAPLAKNTQEAKQGADLIMDVWPQVLTTIKKRHNTLYSILRMARPSLDNDSLILSFAFAFHQKKINEEKTRLVINEVVTQLLGQPVTVVCVIEKNSAPPAVTIASKKTDSNTDSLDTISNIFGGAEVLE